MRIVRDDLWLCQDCMIAAVNGDFTGLDAYLSPEDSEKKMGEINAGLQALGPHLVPDWETAETAEKRKHGMNLRGSGYEDFSLRPCDCCRTRLRGERWRFAILGEDDPPRWIRCYDNGGKTFDRYTVVFTRGKRTYLGMSTYPSHPQGFGQHGEWRAGEPPIDRRPGYAHLGKKIQFSDLPAQCQRLVRSTYTLLHAKKQG